MTESSPKHWLFLRGLARETGHWQPFIDQCQNTLPGEVVNAQGCSIADLCPCEHPAAGSAWKNHGAYVSCVAHATNDFVEAGLLSETEKGEIQSDAGASSCGH